MSGIIESNDYTYTATADLFCTNLDPSGQYTISFQSYVQRDNHFTTGNMGTKIALGSDFTYIRKDGVLKVNLNADYLDSMGINYCRFKNSASTYPAGTTKTPMYIYAFVDSIEYIAPTVSALHIRTDSFITYQDLISNSNTQFIERKTYNQAEDNAVKNNYCLEESISGSNYKREAVNGLTFDTNNFFNNFKIGLIAKKFNINGESRWETAGLTGDPNYTIKVNLNDWCSHMVCGYPVEGNVFVCSDNDELKELMQMLSALGTEVVTTFWIKVGASTSLKTWPGGISYEVQDVTTSVTRVNAAVRSLNSIGVENLTFTSTGFGEGETTFETYTPINKKLYNYPYNYLELSDNCGTSIEYRYEDFGISPDFSAKFLANPTNAIVIMPNGYMGLGLTLDYSLIVEGFPQVGCSSDNYLSYLATHSAQTSLAKYQRYMDYGKSVYNIGQANMHALSNGFTATLDTMNVLAGGDKKALYAQTKSNAGVIESSMKDIGSSIVGLGNSIDNTLNALAASTDMKSQSVNLINAGSADTRACLGYLGCVFYRKFLSAYDAQLIDEYFSRYGYAHMKEETLDLRHCTDYSYIKTKGCNIEGQIPVADKQNLNKLFDSGIWAWKYESGRYGLFADQQHPNK